MPPMMLACLMTLSLGCAEKTRTPVDFEISEGYYGWLTIEFGRKDCPPLQRREGSWVVSFSKMGDACTSTKMELGVARDRFYSVGTRLTELKPLDPASYTSDIGVAAVMYEDGGEVKRQYFFVGTAQSFRESTDDKGLPPRVILDREIEGEKP